jgi:hypothetical protein
MLRCPRTHSGRASVVLGRTSVVLGRSVCTDTTVGVHSCCSRCAPSAFPRTATDQRRRRHFGLRGVRCAPLVARASEILPDRGAGTCHIVWTVRESILYPGGIPAPAPLPHVPHRHRPSLGCASRSPSSSAISDRKFPLAARAPGQRGSASDQRGCRFRGQDGAGRRTLRP